MEAVHSRSPNKNYQQMDLPSGANQMASSADEDNDQQVAGFSSRSSGYKPMRDEERQSDREKRSSKLAETSQTIKDLPSAMMKRVVPKKRDDQPLLNNGNLSVVSPDKVELNEVDVESGSSPYSYNGPQLQQQQQQQLDDEETRSVMHQLPAGTSATDNSYHRRHTAEQSHGDLGNSSNTGTAAVLTVTAEPKQITIGTEIRSDNSSRGSVITFRNLSYEVMVKQYLWSRAKKNVVLDKVNGVMRPGLNAIMGPTGSGKSSLLDLLAGRKDPKCVTGEVLVDGAEQPSNFKCISGYVVQDDIVMGTLTVRENLRFSAALRLPSHRSDKERKDKVEAVIEELGLTRVADSKIGTELLRGVSGGERKRTNIGMELITDPSVLFLDEPTTGLDAFTAGSVIRTLRNLADRGRTIIFSIHQPKYSIYRLFDSLTLVVAGNIIYHGLAGERPLRYFSRIGYECEVHNSPPDFFMDIIHGEVMARTTSNNNLLELDNSSNSAVDTEVQSKKTHLIGQRLIKRWQESNDATAVKSEVDQLYEESLQSGNGFSVQKGESIDYATGLMNQILWVSWRTGLNLFRNPQSSVIQLVVYLFFAVSMGTVYFGLDTSLESGIQNRQGLFFFLILQMVFVNLGAIEVFIKERVIFVHESSSGFYRISVYFLSKIFCDMLPIKTLPVLIFMPIVYFMAGLRLAVGPFFYYELTLVLATCAACGVAFFVSASVSVFGIANIFISIIYVFMMVFGGFLNNISSIPVWLSWCKYLSVFNYAYAGLSANEFVGLNFCPTTEIVNVTRTCKLGIVELDDQSIGYQSAWDLWSNQVGMLLIAIFFLLICYIQLRRINKYK